MNGKIYPSRRKFLQSCSAASLASLASGAGGKVEAAKTTQTPVSLFDGKTLKGWHSASRVPTAKYPGAKTVGKQHPNYQKALSSKGKWEVVDGAIVGGQDPPGSGIGGWLFTDQRYADFELAVDAKPDWSIDTGIYIRTTELGQGFQILIDHRKQGGIGFVFGKGIGGFLACPYFFSAKFNDQGKPIALQQEKKPLGKFDPIPVNYAAPVETFLKTWKFGDWNRFKVRCEGNYPKITTWINGVKICKFDTATLQAPNYDSEKTAQLLGREGLIGFEVHSGDQNRWATGAVSRWKNIEVREL